MTLAKMPKRINTLDTRRGSTIAVQRIRGWELHKIRERILLRDEYTCRRCGLVSVDLEIDHIVPLHLGGRESDENRQALCGACHRAKSAEEEKKRGGL
jgi:5-methylcytosine-specific restriction endonuclease McrA